MNRKITISLDTDKITGTIEMDTFDFVAGLHEECVLDLIQEICESTSVSISDIRKIVNSEGFDE